jgi:uncharacterized protein (TIGR01370 family)
MAILEPDHGAPAPLPGTNTKFYGYISIGEVNDSRPYWKTIRDEPWIRAANPNWPNAHGVDFRAKGWQKLLLDTVIPSIITKRFNGIFLDTIDEALQQFPDTRQALIRWIRSVKAQFPTLGILPNNGLDIVMDIGATIDGVVVEDLYTHYNFQKKISEADLKLDEEKEPILDAFIAKFKKPVYVVLYGDPKSELVRHAIARCKAKGYRWYVTTIDLTTLSEDQ